jgi:hypothetical protein
MRRWQATKNDGPPYWLDNNCKMQYIYRILR